MSLIPQLWASHNHNFSKDHSSKNAFLINAMQKRVTTLTLYKVEVLDLEMVHSNKVLRLQVGVPVFGVL